MKRPSGSLLVSIAIHILLGVLVVTLVRLPLLHDPFGTREDPRVAERIGFLNVPDAGEDTPGRSGGDGLPLTEQPSRENRLVAPAAVPVGVPEVVPGTDAGERGGGAGPVIGRGGVQHGIMPSRTDPRLWSDPPREPTLPMTPTQRVDSVISATFRAYHDSVASAPVARRPTDWTVSRGGRKYGMDEKNIYIGDKSLPNIILALLPLNVQSNPIAGEREKSLAQMRATIQEQAQRAATDDDVQAAFRRIRERRERERQEEQESSPVP
jgi:hypothetical protein